MCVCFDKTVCHVHVLPSWKGKDGVPVAHCSPEERAALDKVLLQGQGLEEFSLLPGE